MFSYISFGQADNKIIWAENKKLSWDDFQGEPSLEIPFHANTNSGISYSWGLEGSSNNLKLNYTVESFFYTDLSWVKPNTNSDYLLMHEQLHFDISELYARKLREKLSKVDSTKLNKDSSKYLNNLYEVLAAQRRDMQNQFDKETDHSKNKEIELKWHAKVAEELNKLAAFDN